MPKILPLEARSAVAEPLKIVSTRQSQVIPSLDGIRAISVLIVVLAHAGVEIAPGGLGVTIFFFLSGYLITTLMLAENEKTGGINIRQFYARRVFRLMPPLAVTLAIAYGLTYAGLLSGGMTVAGLAAQLFYFANYYALFFDPGNSVPSGTDILWSLAVEEHFYIVYPLFLSLLLSSGSALRLRVIAVLLGAACLAVLAWRIHLVHAPGFVPERTYFASDTRIDSIIYGCLLAVLKNPWQDLRRAGPMSAGKMFAGTLSAGPWMILAVATLLFTLVYRDLVFRETIRYSLQGLALMPIFYFVIRFSDNRVFRLLNSPWAVRLGTYSYAIYLFHLVMIGVIVANAPAIAARPWIVLPDVLVASIAFAAAIDRFVDPCFRRLRRRFRTADSSTVPHGCEAGKMAAAE
jgi:peptidoglycan/LPS O-acetylase OafA/YrhL